MKNYCLVAIFVLSLLMLGAVPSFATPEPGPVSDWNREQISSAFDEVARYYGAIEYSVFTFMVEFGRAPQSLDELRETGHLNIEMVNPYTGGEVKSLVPEDYPDGDLAGNVLVSNRRNAGREAHVEAWFLRREEDNTLIIRSMVVRIALYESEVDWDYFFANELPRDEQFVAVYCTQATDAIDSFIQRNGSTPEDFVDMYDNGDVNVHYFNPITGELVVDSETLSAGNYHYEKIGEDGYVIIGWGREEPVFFATTDDDAEAAFYAEYPELMPEE
jgi:hypothetical protein